MSAATQRRGSAYRRLLPVVCAALAIALGCTRRSVITTIPDAALSARPPRLESWTPDLGPLDRSPRTSLDPGSSPQLEASGGPLPRGPGAVQATIYGTHAEVVLRQQFRNDRPVRIDGVYTLRLPAQAVPLGYRITVNDRVFESQVVDAEELRERCPAMYFPGFGGRPPPQVIATCLRNHVDDAASTALTAADAGDLDLTIDAGMTF